MKQRVLFISIGLILCLILAFTAYIKSQSFMNAAASRLSAEATKTLQTEIKIEKINIQSVNQIVVENVAIFDRTGEAIVLADQVQVHFDFIDMIKGEPLIGSIGKVEVVKPVVTVLRRENGEWNYEDLFSSREDKEDGFKGNVVIHEGTVAAHIAEHSFFLEGFSGNFDFSGSPSVSLAMKFMHRGGNAEISGSVWGKDPIITIKTENVNLEDYLAFLPENMTVKLKKGLLKSLNVTLLEEKGQVKMNGEALALGVQLDVEGTSIDEIDGLILFDQNNLRLFSRGSVKEQPVVLKGTVTLDVENPLLDLQISSLGFDASKVLKDFPLLGEIAFAAAITGSYNQPVIDGTMRVEEGLLYGYSLKKVTAKAVFENERLLIEDVEGDLNGGRFSGSGVYRAEDENYQFKIKAQDIPTDTFARVLPGLSGKIQGDIVFGGRGADFDEMLVFGSAAIDQGVYHKVAFDRLRTNFYKNGEQIKLDYVSLVLPQGEIGAEGSVDSGQINLQFRGEQIELAALASALAPSIDARGKASLRGAISGFLDNPRLQMDFSAANGEIFAQPYQEMKGALRLENHQVFLDEMTLKDGETMHMATGAIGLDDDLPVDIKVVTKRARAENLIKLAFAEAVTGNVDNTLLLSGSLTDLKVNGSVTFDEGSFRRVFIKKASGNYSWKDGALTLNDFVVSAPNLQVELDGHMAKDRSIDFSVIADQIDFGKINLQLPYPAAGVGSFDGKLTGTLDSPVFVGKLSADHLAFNGRNLTEINGQVNYQNDRIKLTSFGFKENEGTFTLSGGVDLATEAIYGDLSVSKGNLSTILALAGVKDEWVDGKLDGSVLVAGTMKKPYVHLQGLVPEGKVKGAPLRNLSLDVVLNGKAIKLNKFRAEQNAGVLVAQGKIELDGPVSLEFSGDQIDAGLLLRLADVKTDLEGDLNFGMQVTGTSDNPKVNLSVDIKNGGNGKTSFDTLYGMFRLEDGIIQVDQLLAQKDIYKISAYGVIPLAALMKDKQSYADLKNQMDLKIALDQANLSILPLLTDGVSWAVGETKGSLGITGTLDQPLVNGMILIQDGAVKFDGLGKPMENIELELQFLGDHLELRKFEGKMGKGTYQLAGNAYFDGDGFKDYAVTLDLNQLEIVNKYYTGPLEGHLTLTQDKTGKYVLPKLAGNLDFAYCTIDVPVLPESEEDMPRIKLDLAIQLGKKVRLYNAFLYDIWLDGYAKFEGSTRYPQVSGEITALRGTVNYLKTPFKIKEATAYFNQVNSFLPSLHLEADTRLQRTKVNLLIDGPADEMKIRLTSEPEMNESELLTLLTLRSKYEKNDSGRDDGIGKDELMAFVDIGLQMSFLSEVESVMRNALGVDEFKVVRETLSGNDTREDEEGYNIEIGKYINDKVMLRYAKGISGNDEYKFGVRYDINKHISLTSDLDQDNETSFGIEARFKF